MCVCVCVCVGVWVGEGVCVSVCVMADDAMDENDAMHGWEGHDQVRHVGSCISTLRNTLCTTCSNVSFCKCD